MDSTEVRRLAEKELEQERFRAAVNREKERLSNRKSWFPWRIRIINVNKARQS